MQEIKVPKVKKLKNHKLKVKPGKIAAPKKSKKVKTGFNNKQQNSSGLFYFLFGWLNNRMIFRLIPFSNRRAISIRFRMYALVIAIVLLISVVAVSTYFFTSRSILMRNTAIAQKEYQDRNAELEYLKTSLNDLLISSDYNSITTNIFTKANVIKKGTNIFENDEFINDIEYISEISNMIKNIDISQSYITKMIESLSEREATYQKIANILPIENNLIISISTYERGNQNGVYIEALPSTPIRAAAGAIIKSISYDKDNGYEVVLEHSFNIIATYKGLSSLNIDYSDRRVKKNQVIGYLIGSAFANNTLDYKIKFGNNYINPLYITIGNI